MKQITQNVRNGQLAIEEVPRPAMRPEGILVQSCASLVSAGTERMMMELAKKSLLGKARQRPDLVKKVMAKVRRDGFWATFTAVRERLDRAVSLGYSVAGRVLEVGAKAVGFEVGQAVACAGAGYANHAEMNYVPRLLAVGVPEGVGMESAAYGTVGAIALQGVRNADVRVGEAVAVVGLGLIGQLTVQILKAAGCRVIGLDLNPRRVELAEQGGAELAMTLDGEATVKRVYQFTRGRGADAILITAATRSNEPIEMAAEMARHRARVVMVGVTGMDVPRKPYYEKELSLVVSCSYGPGRYDPQYEEHGHDYPAGHVRWTENRNIEAFLDMVAAGSVRPEMLTTHRFDIAEAESAFELIFANQEPHLGVVLTYPAASESDTATASTRVNLRSEPERKPIGRVGVSFVGGGGFARSVLLPGLKKLADVEFRGMVTASGISSRATGEKFGFAFCASNETKLHQDDATNAVVIVTPHLQHADGICRALAAGKAVFVEKPLAVNREQLDEVVEAVESHNGRLMVGFNRRFSPLAGKLKEHVAGQGPMSVVYRCNAGPLGEDHWLADPDQGGRIIGEACHFFDFFTYLIDARAVSVFARGIPAQSPDDAHVTVTYTDGSVCQLLYTTAGPSSFSKERIEVFVGGRVGVLDDFRRLHLQTDTARPRRHKLARADKGHAAELSAFIAALRDGGEMPIPLDSLLETTRVSFAVMESMGRGEAVSTAQLACEVAKTTTGS